MKETKINQLKRYAFIKGSLVKLKGEAELQRYLINDEYDNIITRISIINKECLEIRKELVNSYNFTVEETLKIMIDNYYRGFNS